MDKALITHGHSDHARRGHRAYLTHVDGVGILRHRLGKINVQGIQYGETMRLHGVDISFHPAGHVLGSAMIRLQDDKECWVISGDYKTVADGVSEPYAPVSCDHFVTESTFGLPIFQWQRPEAVHAAIDNWWAENQAAGRPSMLAAYSLGKAQRVLRHLTADQGPIIAHPAVEKINELTREAGVALPDTQAMEDLSDEDLKKAIIIAPPMAMDSKWSSRIKEPSHAVASGWMALRGTRRRRNVNRGFALSDHVDWPGLNAAVSASGAEHIHVTHGYTAIYTRYLNEQGYVASVVQTEYEGESLETQPTSG